MIKESWVVTFVDKVLMVVYATDILSKLINEPAEPVDQVIGVEYVIREWSGSWDTDPPTRSYSEIYRATVDLSTFKEWR